MADTYRDLLIAQNIRLGIAFPLTGPPVYNTIHLGPLWFYFLSLPYWITDNPAVVQAFIGALNALKFFFAYRLGKLYGGPRTGLFFAVALLYPGWSCFIFWSFTHSIMAEATVLIGALVALYYREKKNQTAAALLGIAVALMMHAHPTTLFIAALFVVAALLSTASWKQRFAHLAVILFFAILPLMPMLMEQSLQGFPDLQALTQYGNIDVSWPSFSRLIHLLNALFLYGPAYLLRYWFGLPLSLCYFLTALLAVSLVLVILGLTNLIRQQPRNGPLVAILVTVLLTQTLFVMFLRPVTPFWMVYAHWPFIAALCALGAEGVYRFGKLGKGAAWFMLLLWVSWSFCGTAYIASSPHEVSYDVPPPGKHGLVNIADLNPFKDERLDVTVARLPVSELPLVSAPLCQPVRLYGHYALFVDASFGLGAIRHCGQTGQIRLGGPQDTVKAWLGLRDYAWEKIGAIPEAWLGSLGIASPEKIWHSPEPLSIANYPEHQEPTAPEGFSIVVDIPSDRFILITKRIGPLKVQSATVNSSPVSDAYHDIPGAFVFKAPSTLKDSPAHWVFTLYGDPRYVDVVSFQTHHVDASVPPTVPSL